MTPSTKNATLPKDETMELGTSTKNATLPKHETMELGYGALLVAEAEDGSYEPVGVVSTIKEARFIAKENFQHRTGDLEKGRDPICPDRYVVWVRGLNGYRVFGNIEVR